MPSDAAIDSALLPALDARISAARFPNTFTTPPGDYQYRVPETGQHFKGISMHQLVTQVSACYRANGYLMPANIEALIEHYNCARLPDWCVGGPQRLPMPSLSFSFTNVLQGTRTLGSWLLGGRKLVDANLSEQRAAVCVTCPMNTEPEGCTNCNSGALAQAVDIVVGTRRTSYAGQLRSCSVCFCQLNAKVQLPHAILWAHMEDAQKQRLPAHCWLVTECPTTPEGPG